MDCLEKPAKKLHLTQFCISKNSETRSQHSRLLIVSSASHFENTGYILKQIFNDSFHCVLFQMFLRFKERRSPSTKRLLSSMKGPVPRKAFQNPNFCLRAIYNHPEILLQLSLGQQARLLFSTECQRAGVMAQQLQALLSFQRTGLQFPAPRLVCDFSLRCPLLATMGTKHTRHTDIRHTKQLKSFKKLNTNSEFEYLSSIFFVLFFLFYWGGGR